MIKNKIYALALFSIGVASAALSHDVTFLVLISRLAVPMFFSEEEWIV